MSGTPRPLAALHYFATDQSLPVADFARAAAELGFDAVLLPEHTHIPVCTGSPYPGGGGLPERYRRTLDPYVALSVVAAQTDLKIGTCISLIAQHDPIALAKTIATLDFVSGGRFSLGVGYGWNVPELANHGREAAKRREIVREYVGLMRALWQDTEAEFHGDHANLSPSWAWPKPVQQPSVPVLLGCQLTPRGYAEIVGWADGWIGFAGDLDVFAAQVTTLRSRWAEAGPRPGRSSGRCSAPSTTAPCAGASSASGRWGSTRWCSICRPSRAISSPSSIATPRRWPRSSIARPAQPAGR